MGTDKNNYKGSINQCKAIKGFYEFFEVLRICKKIGIETMEDIASFINTEIIQDETLYQSLVRYEKEFDEARYGFI